jgi:hypothetical protein
LFVIPNYTFSSHATKPLTPFPALPPNRTQPLSISMQRCDTSATSLSTFAVYSRERYHSPQPQPSYLLRLPKLRLPNVSSKERVASRSLLGPLRQVPPERSLLQLRAAERPRELFSVYASWCDLHEGGDDEKGGRAGLPREKSEVGGD